MKCGVFKNIALLMMCCCVNPGMAAPQGVSVELRSCRTEYRTHNSSTAPGLICTLELVPPPGMQMCESASLTGVIRVKDARGSVFIADRRGVEIGSDNRALTTFTLRRRPSGNRIELQGALLVTVAAERTAHEPVPVSMTEPAELKLSDSLTIKTTPSSLNGSTRNREGGKIRRAELELSAPRGITIRRIERVWHGINGEMYTQPVELVPTGSTTYQIELWDTNPSEHLRIVTVRNPRREHVDFRMQVTLSDVSTK